jgi:NitT/TauT family transport system ATP-binding protein
MMTPPNVNFVAMKGVRLIYGRGSGTHALEGLDLNVGQGKFAAVVGPSGCGKSSLMKLVTGLLPPTAGIIEVGGKKVDGPLNIAGMAFQNPTLLPWRQTLSNVLLPFEIVEQHRYRIRRDRTGYEKQARALLHSVGLAGFESKYPWELSGGMQQRASLCRALVHQPALLMLDEPFGALDAFTREDLWDVLQDLWLERHCTTILVTHDLREAVYLADRVHVMSNRPGHIVATHEVPLHRPRRPDTLYEPRFIDIVHILREQIRAQSPDSKHTAAETVR